MRNPVNLAADTILVNGRVHTLEPRNPRVEAVAVRDGKILAVGSTPEIEALAGATTQVVELRGRTVIPGVADVHVHLADEAAKAHHVECRDFFEAVHSVPDILERMRQRAVQTPPGEWVVGHGSPMQEFRLAEGRRPTKAELDSVTPAHPAFVYFGAHVTVANSLALRAAGITRDTPDPLGGVVVKDPATGEPTGELRERAQLLLRTATPQTRWDQLKEGIALLLERCLARGVTTIHDIIVSKDEVRAYQELHASGRLPVRVHLLIRVIESHFNRESLLDLGFTHGLGDEFLKIGGVKLSIDGGFTGRNAAFYEPMAGQAADHQLVRIPQEELDDVVWRYHQAGMRVCVHAIGDRALDMCLETYEKALHRMPRADHRHRIEHFGNWLVTPERLARARRLHVLPIPNPSMSYHLGKEVLTTLGPKRTEHVFPFRALLDAGFPLTFGSDAPGYWPVDPIRDFGNAVSRKAIDGVILSPEEAISVKEGIRAQTVNAAYAGFEEHRLGSLEAGKLADLIVLAADPQEVPPDQIKDIPVDMTMVGGRVVYQR